MKIRKSSLFSFLCLFVWIMLNLLNISLPIRIIIRTILLAILILKKFNKNNYVFKLLVIYLFFSILSVRLFDYSFSNLAITFNWFCMPLGMVLLFLDKKANKNLLLVQSLGIYSFILFLDILVLLFKDNGLSQNSFNQAIYFSGGKFSAIYIYLAWLMLFFQVKKDINRKWAIVLMAIGIIYSYCLDCMTGVVAIFSFGVIMLIPQNLCTGRKGIIWILAVVVITILLVFFQVQTSVLWIKNIITKVLNSSISLTGRVSIYDAIPKIMKDHWMLGWGYTSTRIVQITGLANMQNGFLQLIYNNGVLGTIPFLLVMLIAIKKVIELKDLKIGRVFLASIVSFFVIAIVEIPFNTTSFFLLIACIFMQSNSEINANEFYKGSTDIK